MKEKISDKRLGEIWDELEESILHADCNVGEMREQQKIVIELLTARQTIRRLENAWMIDETIQADGSLKPSISDTVERYENIIKRLNEEIKSLENIRTITVPVNFGAETKAILFKRQKKH